MAGGPDRGLRKGRRRVRARASGVSLGRAGEPGDDVQPGDRAGTALGHLDGPRRAARLDRPMAGVAGGTPMNTATTARSAAAPREQSRARYPDSEGYVERDGVNVFYEL